MKKQGHDNEVKLEAVADIEAVADVEATDIEAAVATYRRELVAAAELARGDLDEIEDHLRMLALELRDNGMPVAEAVAEAARRLGDPAELAREHARVRPTFGARLSRGRAWSAAALLGVVMIASAVTLPEIGVLGAVMEFVPGVVLFFGLVARLSWARPILLGSLATSVVFFGLVLALAPEVSLHPINILTVGIVAFLVPWRRGELSKPGLALVLQMWMFGTVVVVGGAYGGSAFPVVGVLAGMLAVPGIILRARWSVVFSAITTVALAITCVQVAAMPYVSSFWSALILFGVTGVAAGVVSLVLQYRTARSRFGTFEAVLR